MRSYFSFGSKNIPHINKRYKGGEDAWYADDQLLVVLDGVSDWNDLGIDPALFSKQLIKLIEQEHLNDRKSELVPLLDNALK